MAAESAPTGEPPSAGIGAVIIAIDSWLKASGMKVTYVRNVTDIDDKILVKSAEQGRPWFNLAYDMTRAITAAYDALHVLPPTYEPLATGHIPEMVELIEEGALSPLPLETWPITRAADGRSITVKSALDVVRPVAVPAGV